jgi:hypothetical protein
MDLGVQGTLWDDYAPEPLIESCAETSQQGKTAVEFLEELFQDAYCDFCGGDSIHHTAVPVDCMGWFVPILMPILMLVVV